MLPWHKGRLTDLQFKPIDWFLYEGNFDLKCALNIDTTLYFC